MPPEKATTPATVSPKTPILAAARPTPSASELTREQRNALFDAAAKGMTPIHHKIQPEDPVRPWIRQILRKHKDGFSPAQIATMAATPGINLKISARAVSRLIAAHAKRKTPNVPSGG